MCQWHIFSGGRAAAPERPEGPGRLCQAAPSMHPRSLSIVCPAAVKNRRRFGHLPDETQVCQRKCKFRQDKVLMVQVEVENSRNSLKYGEINRTSENVDFKCTFKGK